MSRTATLAQLRFDISEQCDIAGAVGTTQRYSTTLLNRLINQSLQRFRERVTNEAPQHYLVPAAGTLTAGATSGMPYGFFYVPTSAVRTYGVDITVNGETRSLSYVPFNQRDMYGGPSTTGEPQAWTHISTWGIALFPPPSQAYSYTVWYLPVAPDLVADSDKFEGVAGHEDFITWDVVCRLIVRDTYPQAYQMAVSYRSDVWADIIRAATKVTGAGGGTIARDTFGRRIMGLFRTRRLPPP